MVKGSCLCGSVAFELTGRLRSVTGCHCQQFRKQSGHYWAATSSADADIRMISDDGLTWYRASDLAQRGFCRFCGSTLFWKPEGEDRTAISAGCLDGETGLKMAMHVHVADKGDYYDITGDLPHYPALSGQENA